ANPVPESAPGGDGSPFATRYEFLGKLGAGGQGAVFKVMNHSALRAEALKVVPAAAPSNEDRDRFRGEVLGNARLRHDGIVMILHVGFLNPEQFTDYSGVMPSDIDGVPLAGMPFFTMEFAERGTLQDLIRRHFAPPGPDLANAPTVPERQPGGGEPS